MLRQEFTKCSKSTKEGIVNFTINVPLTPSSQKKVHGSESWRRMLEENHKLLQLEAISPVAMTGEAGRMLNAEGESRRNSQAQVPSGPGKQIREAGIKAEAIALFIS